MTRESEAGTGGVRSVHGQPRLDPAAPTGGAPKHTTASIPEVYPRHRCPATYRPRTSRPGHDRRSVLARGLCAQIRGTTNSAPWNASAGNLRSISRMDSEPRGLVARCSVFMSSRRQCITRSVLRTPVSTAITQASWLANRTISILADFRALVQCHYPWPFGSGDRLAVVFPRNAS